MRPSQLVEQMGGSYATELGIELTHRDPGEIGKWLVAAILFGARISGRIAIRTYREFEHAGVLSPRRIADAGWDALVALLDRGGYARYDFKTATKLLEVSHALLRLYAGNLNRLHDTARDTGELAARIKALGKGVGEVTAEIFLRELRGIWPLAQPLPAARAIAAAKALQLVPPDMDDPARVLARLQKAWQADGGKPDDFREFEAALVRYAATQPRTPTRFTAPPSRHRSQSPAR